MPTSTGGASVAFGDSATVTGANAVGLGNSASVTGVNAVALGTNVKATTSDAVVIGTAAKTETAGGGVAIGQNAYSKGLYGNTPSVAVGKNSIANGGTAYCCWYLCDGKRSLDFIFTRYCHWWWCITGARGYRYR